VFGFSAELIAIDGKHEPGATIGARKPAYSQDLRERVLQAVDKEPAYFVSCETFFREGFFSQLDKRGKR
jgi:hypothetical protein